MIHVTRDMTRDTMLVTGDEAELPRQPRRGAERRRGRGPRHQHTRRQLLLPLVDTISILYLLSTPDIYCYNIYCCRIYYIYFLQDAGRWAQHQGLDGHQRQLVQRCEGRAGGVRGSEQTVDNVGVMI